MRELARVWIGLARVCVYATMDNVAISHAHNLSKLARAHTRLGHVAKFACATLVKLQTRAYVNATIDNVTNLHGRDLDKLGQKLRNYYDTKLQYAQAKN